MTHQVLEDEEQAALDVGDTAAALSEEQEPEAHEAELMPAKQPDPEKPKAMTIMDTGETSLLNPAIYVQMKQLANDFIQSEAIPKCWTTSSQVLVGLQTGVEMGMKPMEAMRSLYIVNGMVNIWGAAVIRRVKEHGYQIKYSAETQETCTATITKGKEKYIETYTYAEAHESGYTTDNYGKLKVGWKPGANRKLKLRYGVMSMIIKTYIPDVLGSAAGIVEVDQDFKEPKQLVTAHDKVAKALADRNSTIEDTTAGAIK